MKNLFTINMDDDNDSGAYEKFLLRRADAELIKKQDESIGLMKEHEQKASLPKWLILIRGLCMMFFFIVLIAYIKSWNENGLKTFTAVPWLTVSGAICGFIALVLWLIEKQKASHVMESQDFHQNMESIVNIHKESLDFLQVPENALNVDVFSRPYKIKNGKEKRATDLFEYINFDMLVFREGEMLCLADDRSVIGIPLSDITGIYKINKRVNFSGWNKEDDFNTGAYKPYKITQNNYGILYIKPYYSLRFTGYGEVYEILFPAYELDTFVRLTDASVKEDA